MENSAPLMLFNSLTRSLEPFVPIHEGEARVYSCGPTVYNYQHIGNMRAYIFADTLGRTLSFKGYKLTHVINITDVGHLTSDADAGDDKMSSIATPIADGAMAFLKAEYRVLAIYVVVAGLLLGWQSMVVTTSHPLIVVAFVIGAAFSVQPILMQSAWFRPHNKCDDVEGLYFVGAGTHPGAGIPGVIGSAKATAKLMLEGV